jgi:hypothetical protein
MNKKSFFSIALLAVLFTACKKETAEITIAEVSDYAPLTVGKFITYKLDSFVFTNFGTKDTTISYQLKHTVDAAITDNLGRPAFRIVQSIRKNDSQPWVTNNTYTAINTGSSFEFVENNLRYVKLKQPFNDGFTWKGNSYIETSTTNPTGPSFIYLNDWDYTYDGVATSASIGTLNFPNTIKINQRDEVIGNPADPASYSEINFGEEKYAAGIGLIYRKFLHVEYQPPTSSSGYKTGYGVTLTITGYN